MSADIVKIANDLAETATVTVGDLYDGVQAVVTFPNGYGASIIDHSGSYGVELAVLGKDGGITYTTPVTDDVLGHLDGPTLVSTLAQIAAL